MRLLFTLILLFSLDSFTARSQALIFQATRLHDDGSHATLIVPASDQGSLVAGYSTRGSTGFLDLTKFDEFRDRKWSVTYEVTDTLLRTKAACNFGEDGYLIAASLESPPPAVRISSLSEPIRPAASAGPGVIPLVSPARCPR